MYLQREIHWASSNNVTTQQRNIQSSIGSNKSSTRYRQSRRGKHAFKESNENGFQEIVSKVAEAQREAGSEAIGRLSLDSELPALNLTRYVTIAGVFVFDFSHLGIV